MLTTEAVTTDQDRGKLIRSAYLFTLFCLGVGVATTYRYLETEFARIEPEERALIWWSETPALIWFTWYFIKHSLLARPVASTSGNSSSLSRQWWIALLTLVLGQGFGLWTFIGLANRDVAGLERSLPAVGQVVAVSKWTTVMAYGYFLDVQFLDRQGARHEGYYHVVENKKKGFIPRIPIALKKALKDRVLPTPIHLYYDPQWPARNWLLDADGDLVDNYNDRIYYMGICLLVVQLVAIFNFAVALKFAIKGGKELPWWYDLHLALPLMILAVFIGFVGGFTVGLAALFDLILRGN